MYISSVLALLSQSRAQAGRKLTSFSDSRTPPLNRVWWLYRRATSKIARTLAASRGKMKRMLSSKSSVKSKFNPQPRTMGPKSSWTLTGHLGVMAQTSEEEKEELVAVLVLVSSAPSSLLSPLSSSSSSLRAIVCRQVSSSWSRSETVDAIRCCGPCGRQREGHKFRVTQRRWDRRNQPSALHIRYPEVV